MNTLPCLLLLVGTGSIWNMEIIPERGNVTYVNEKYLKDARFYIRRYSRRSPYYINSEGRPLYEWGNNISMHFYFYEFLHNEYRRSFVELHYKEFCKWINKNSYIGAAIRESICLGLDADRKGQQDLKYNDICEGGGFKCPIPGGFYKIHNMSIPAANFPNVWPFEKCRVDVVARSMPSDEVIFELQVYVLFKQKLGK